MAETFDIDEEQYKKSICFRCNNLISRDILPIDYSDFDISEEDLLDEEGNIVPVKHDVCSILGMDLTHIVLTCNKFRNVNNKDIGIFGRL